MAKARGMHKKLFSAYVPVEVVEVHICPRCGLYWFSENNLEVLRYVVEKLEEEDSFPREDI